MAIINKSISYMEFPLQIKRQYAGPVDPTSVLYSLEEAQTYAASSATAYVGQELIVVDEVAGTATAYLINDTAGTLTEIGSATLGDDKSIVLTDGTLSLKNFGVQYYRYVPATETSESTYELVSGFKAGLQPQVHEVSSGVYEIAWYEPNPTTVEGLSTRLSEVETKVSNTYSKTEIDAKLSEIPEWGDIE